MGVSLIGDSDTQLTLALAENRETGELFRVGLPENRDAFELFRVTLPENRYAAELFTDFGFQTLISWHDDIPATQLYTPLCRSVGPSVTLYFFGGFAVYGLTAPAQVIK